jgi:streptogramin lyase
LASLVGCSASFNSQPVAGAASVSGLNGSVHGGQQPVTGSHVYLFAAGNAGYQSASTSLLNTSATGVATDAGGNGYVTTDSGGNFTITGDWTCAHATDQVYMLAMGGNPGLAPGTNNTAIVMMNALGTCSTVTSSTFVNINELSTVVAVTALHHYLQDGTHVGTSLTNPAGLTNAFATVANMVDVGANSARTTTPGGNGTVPQPKLHTMANILSACVNSASNTSSACNALFSAAATTGNGTPTDTLGAMRNIAGNLGNGATLFALSPPSPPFQPSLTSAPADFTFSVTYALGSGTPLPANLAIDGSGNVWISNYASSKFPAGTDSIIELSPTGAILSGTGFTSGPVGAPQGLAIDDSGNVWVANGAGNILRLNNAGAVTAGFPVTVSGQPQGIALDTSGNAWVTNAANNTVLEYSPTGAALQSGITSPGFLLPEGIALDTSGNVWVAGLGSNSILKLNSAGVVQSGSGAGYTGGGLNAPSGLVIDGSGNLWVANSISPPSVSTISKFTSAGTAVTTSAGYGSGTPGYEILLAIDGGGQVLSASCGPKCVGSGVDNVVALNSDGSLATGTGGYQNPDFNAPQGIAIDSSGNVWVANTAAVGNAIAGTVTEVIGISKPVKTPLQAALKAGLLGQQP